MDNLEDICSIPPRQPGLSPLDNSDVTYRHTHNSTDSNTLNVIYKPATVKGKLYGNPDLIIKMHGDRQTIMHQDNDAYINQAYSYENLDRCGFINRCGTKLANIDYHFEVTGRKTDLFNPQINGIFKFCDVASGPGGFTDYIFYRRPDSIGFGITYGIQYDKKLKNKNFTEIRGPDGTGNLFTSWEAFRDEVIYKNPDAFDLVTADAGFLEDNDTTRNLARELMGFPLFFIECYLGFRLLKVGGDFVCKSYETVTETSVGLIYLLSQMFESVSIFKPITSRSYNLEAYVICKNRNSRVDTYGPCEELIRRMSSQISSGRVYDTFPTRLYDNLPVNFVNFIEKNNDLRMSNIVKNLEIFQRLAKSKGKENKDVPRADLHKFILYLNVPSESFERSSTRADNYLREKKEGSLSLNLDDDG